MCKEDRIGMCVVIDDLNKYKVFFDEFTGGFKSNDEFKQSFYDQKIKHSYDVAKIIVKLGVKMNFNSKFLNFLFIIGLYHDIGRFKQFAEFNTANDKEIDHGNIAAEMIPELDVFNSLSKKYIETIRFIIKEHNKSEIDNECKGEILKLCNMLRDADKLSLFPYFIANFDNIRQYCKEPLSNSYSSKFINKIINKEKFYVAETKTIKEFKLYILSWMNDIAFDVSKDVIRDNAYIQKILYGFEINENILQLEQHFKDLI